MKNTPVILLLDSFNDVEWKKCKLYLKNTSGVGEELAKLYSYFFKYRADLQHPKVEVNIINKLLYPHLNKKAVQNIYSKLKKAVEDYILFKELEAQPLTKQMLLFDALNNRGVFDQANKVAKNITIKHIDSEGLNIWKYPYRWKLLHKQFFSHNPIKYSKDGLHIYHQMLKDFNSLFDSFKLYYEIEYQYLKKHTSISISSLPLDARGQVIERDEVVEIELLNLLKIAIPDNLKPIQRILKIIENEKISFELIATSILYCKNVINQHINKGDVKLFELFIKLHELGFDKGVFSINGKISALSYHNYLRVLYNLKAFAKAKAFVSKYSDKIEKNEIEEAQHFAKAQYYFFSNSFEQLINLLSDKHFKDVTMRTNARELLIMSHVELHPDAFDFLDTMLSNHKKYLHYQKKNLSDKSYQGRYNLASYMQMLVGKEHITKVRQFVKKEKIINRRIWVNSQLDKYK